MTTMLKRTGAAIALCLIALFLYANLRTPTMTEALAPIHLKVFSVGQPLDAQTAEAVKSVLRQQPGITAVSLDASLGTFSVTYHPDKADPLGIASAASLNGRFEVKEKYFPPRPACPVPPLDALRSKVLDAFKVF